MSVSRKRLVSPHDPILIQIAKPIPQNEIASKETEQIIERLLTIAYGEQKDRAKPVLVGLAAPQAGISKRIILVDVGADGHGGVSNLQVFINPEIMWSSTETSEWYEGCYSTDRVCGIVERSNLIKLSAYKRDGSKFEYTYDGYVARIFQHEIDHLNGKEFISHITDDSKLHLVEEDEFPKYRDREAWRNWPNKCPRAKWEQIKGTRS